MPFGLTNAEATFHREMHFTFKYLINKIIIIYLDDMIIFLEKREEHVKHVV